jgi:photosystem II stability/assembly factor-like uncharacterized protein
VNPAYNLKGVWFTDANNGIAVGWDPAILYGGAVLYRTTDGGGTWSFQPVTPNKYLSKIAFLDANIGVIVGGNPYTNGGVILRTTNGGITWVEQTSPRNDGLYGISFANTTVGFSVGASGTIFRTTDGGVTWTAQTSGTYLDLFGVHCVDSSTAFVVGGGATGGSFGQNVILSTTNGGASWTKLLNPASNGLLGVYFTDRNTGTVVGGGGAILRTTTGGLVSVEERVISQIPTGFVLSQNYPNPFNPSTVIRFELPLTSKVSLHVYNMLGQKVVTLVNEEMSPGSYEAIWNASGFPSGVYFYRLQVGRVVETKKLILLR